MKTFINYAPDKKENKMLNRLKWYSEIVISFICIAGVFFLMFYVLPVFWATK
jgi:hypothetical protein